MKLPKEITVHFIDSKSMRYDTTDDYVWDGDALRVLIEDRDNIIDRMAILIHALAEFAVADAEGITIERIDEWDFSHLESPEPGSEPECPYGKAHGIAVAVEAVFRALTDTPDGG